MKTGLFLAFVIAQVLCSDIFEIVSLADPENEQKSVFHDVDLKQLAEYQTKNSRIVHAYANKQGEYYILPGRQGFSLTSQIQVIRVPATTLGAFWLDNLGKDTELAGLQFYGQSLEDKYLFSHFFHHQRNGIYIELGATDGFKYSNTLFFHETLDWKGVLIEPTKGQFEVLRSNRPYDQLLNIAIAEEEGELDFIGDAPVSGVYEYLPQDFLQRFHKNKTKSDTYKVKSGPIGKYLNILGIDHVDIFSIDVEESEIGVLSSMDWSIPVHVIIIELANRNPSKDEKCREILRKNGFSFYERIPAYNEVWVNKNYQYTPRSDPYFHVSNEALSNLMR